MAAVKKVLFKRGSDCRNEWLFFRLELNTEKLQHCLVHTSEKRKSSFSFRLIARLICVYACFAKSNLFSDVMKMRNSHYKATDCDSNLENSSEKLREIP